MFSTVSTRNERLTVPLAAVGGVLAVVIVICIILAAVVIARRRKNNTKFGVGTGETLCYIRTIYKLMVTYMPHMTLCMMSY